MKTIRLENMRRMPWKNGLGVTTEIALFPETASLVDASFDWRISIAEIVEAGRFSTFLGFDRLLLFWSGQGLNLNGHMLDPFQVHRFRGEEEVHAEPTGSVQDLGIIFRRGRFRAEMGRLSAGEISLMPGRHFVINLGSPCEILSGETYRLRHGDALDFGDNSETCVLQAHPVLSGEVVTSILISIYPVQDIPLGRASSSNVKV